LIFGGLAAQRFVSPSCWEADHTVACKVLGADFVGHMLSCLFVLAGLIRLWKRTSSPRERLRGMWRLARLFWCSIAMTTLIAVVTMAAVKPAFASSVSFISYFLISVSYFVSSGVVRPDWRGCVQDWLMRLFNKGSAQPLEGVRAAATISAMISQGHNHSLASTLDWASKNFSVVNHSKLSISLFDRNVDVPTRAQLGRLGACDAFVSHSWSDSHELKWQALARWASSFEKKHKHTPNYWIDKLSIDQVRMADVEYRVQVLSCLPVFLSGCKSLVILAGPTYINRLWCVIEVFSFIQMGGKVGHIYTIPVGAASAFDFANFDVRKARCTTSEDEQRLRAIIETGYGNLDGFNQLVHGLLQVTTASRSQREVQQQWQDQQGREGRYRRRRPSAPISVVVEEMIVESSCVGTGVPHSAG
jgi:hypothetical protein